MKEPSEKVINNRLNTAFNADYSQYEQTASFFPVIEDNIWKFVIDELNMIITLTYDIDKGIILTDEKIIGEKYIDEDGKEYLLGKNGERYYNNFEL